jgi:hypothetical protein
MPFCSCILPVFTWLHSDLWVCLRSLLLQVFASFDLGSGTASVQAHTSYRTSGTGSILRLHSCNPGADSFGTDSCKQGHESVTIDALYSAPFQPFQGHTHSSQACKYRATICGGHVRLSLSRVYYMHLKSPFLHCIAFSCSINRRDILSLDFLTVRSPTVVTPLPDE